MHLSRPSYPLEDNSMLLSDSSCPVADNSVLVYSNLTVPELSDGGQLDTF